MTDSYVSAANPWSTWANQIDPFGQRYTEAGSWLGAPQYAYGAPNIDPNAQYYDPSNQIPTDSYSPISIQTGGALTNSYLDQYHDKTYSWLDQAGSQGGGGNAGTVTDLGNDWAKVDSWDAAIQKAVQQVAKDTGVYVPVNFVKSVMKLESGGENLPINDWGAMGPMQVTANTVGNYDVGKLASDPAYNIQAGVNELALHYNQGDPSNPSQKSWEWAAKRYLGLGVDPSNGTTDDSYWKQVSDNWSQLGAGQQYQQQQGTGSVTPGTNNFTAIWHGGDAAISQGFGMTDFARQQLSQGLGNEYQYTDQYSLDHQPIGHDGIDVELSWGTPLYAPLAGKISIIGSADGQNYFYRMAGKGADGTPAMGSEINANNAGELAITLANGDVYILGHMSQIVKPDGTPYGVGDTVAPGQFVGYSGGSNGAHVHVEYRKWLGPNGVGNNGVDQTGSGYLAIDPQKAFTGDFTGSFSGTGSLGPAPVSGASDFQNFLRSNILGLPTAGTIPSGQSSFHDYLRNFMIGSPKNTSTSSNLGWILSGGGSSAPPVINGGAGSGPSGGGLKP